ncbi:MAG: adenylate/guanylate cyclase domain-containing protein, partial [Chloroflexota bacterium]|nr:adenylate/guanylate cyclase domain-containing protein [Chloroflexota bacterium]
MNEIEQLEQAIASLEEKRSELGDSVVDSAVSSIKIRLVTLKSYQIPSEKQRKLVSILFMDIADSTKIGQHLDPEDVMEMMDTALQQLAAPVFNHNGRVTRYMGDGFMAVFGAPIAREDDTRNAVGAGLEILKEAEPISHEIQSTWGVADFRVRVGVNTGHVAVGGVSEGINMIMGRTVNLAARMESAAPTNSLLITHSAYRHVRGLFDVVKQPPLDIKGEDKPVVTYLVLGARPHATSIAARGIEGVTTPLVGRERELEALETCYEIARVENKTHVYTIHSGPGIGKTRLVQEFKRLLLYQEDDGQIFEGYGIQKQINNPYSLFQDLFARYLDIRESDDLDSVRGKIEQGIGDYFKEDGLQTSHYIGALLGFDFWQSPYLEAVKGDPEQLRLTGQYYLQQFIINLVGDTPTTIILDDLQWGDDSSLSFLDKFVHDFDALPLLVLNITRPELFDRRPEWGQAEVDADDRFRRKALSALSEDESCDLINQILEHAEQVPARLCQMILDNAGGNPYYIEEFLNVLIDDGVIQRGAPGKAWVIDLSRLEALRVPPTLTALLQARLDHLPVEEKQTLQQASVVGLNFWDEIISILQGIQSPPADILGRLSKRDLIQPVGDSTFEGTREYRFKHALMQEVSYESVIKKTRPEYHGKVAGWLESQTRSIGRQGEFSAVIAEHYQHAEEDDQASEWYLQAGDRAKSVAAPLEARKFYELASDLNPADNMERRWQILLGHVEVVGTLGDTEVRQMEGLALVEMARQFADDKRLATALIRKGHFEAVTGDFQNSINDLNKALACARKAGDLELRTVIHGLLVVSQTRSGNLADAFITAEKALELSRELKDDEIRARTLTNVAILYAAAGDIAGSARLLEEQVQINSRMGNKAGEAIGYGNLGYDYVQLGLFDQGREALERSIELAENIGMRLEISYQKLNLALANCWSGNSDQGRMILEAAIPDLKQIGDLFGTGAGFNYMGLCLESAGDIEGAIEVYLESYRLLNEIGASSYAVDPAAGLARCYQLLDRKEEASQYINRVWEYLGEHGGAGMEFPLWAYLTCAEFYDSINDLESASKAVHDGHRELMARAD